MILPQVGNGCVGNEVGGCGSISGLKIQTEFYHGHALISDVSRELLVTTDHDRSLCVYAGSL